MDVAVGQLFLEVFEKNVAIKGWSSVPPQWGHLIPPASRSLMVRVNETSLSHFGQWNS